MLTVLTTTVSRYRCAISMLILFCLHVASSMELEITEVTIASESWQDVTNKDGSSLFFDVFRMVYDNFDKFIPIPMQKNELYELKRVYPEKFEKSYGFWRPIIRTSIERYLKCGDLKEGFARIHCFDCDRGYFLPFSCKARCCCCSC
ncbi:MAG: transposase zinc-binding domain-containing protein, partial [Chitinivibrionales bacterium]|nr:transposase zinc-binding domain-containing protein [Chitinivibrionales bacterium]